MNQKAKSRLAKELEGLLKNPISDDKRPIAHKIKLITQNDNLIRHYIDGEFEIFKSAVASGLPRSISLKGTWFRAINRRYDSEPLSAEGSRQGTARFNELGDFQLLGH